MTARLRCRASRFSFVGIELSDSSERLRRLEALTDPALVHLDTEELLHELIDRVEDLLDVDTVAVLLVDPTGSALIARAARGLEEEVHQGVRLPLGRGFAGRITATRAPVVARPCRSGHGDQSSLWQKGVRALLGVPLIADNRLLGVMHVGRLACSSVRGGTRPCCSWRRAASRLRLVAADGGRAISGAHPAAEPAPDTVPSGRRLGARQPVRCRRGLRRGRRLARRVQTPRRRDRRGRGRRGRHGCSEPPSSWDASAAPCGRTRSSRRARPRHWIE